MSYFFMILKVILKMILLITICCYCFQRKYHYLNHIGVLKMYQTIHCSELKGEKSYTMINKKIITGFELTKKM